ncbi:hypothetical protein GUITHDRAFT_111445 [Guillardia theta CCMP2712]|uniref:Uncharacterized protein n=1 Tax=Guillardia theta (strain CCMP2712) TaxID=905079 RepID=L1J2D6_GUITC|nr:hypothetical protein GUITHDRAFT_111445 [Guillardia theta CCMP2712]EKX42472.1 hypothetical protein GUITHDRAFT_111445 [Guillardia theta CCMP2712]|eukprot:XP_005829452.1 hypothetical protein GUITHDRAFT_111445 [Guillardia theta CCMP2712]
MGGANTKEQEAGGNSLIGCCSNISKSTVPPIPNDISVKAGVGIVLGARKDGVLFIAGICRGSPAERSKLRVSALLKGEEGTSLSIEVRRPRARTSALEGSEEDEGGLIVDQLVRSQINSQAARQAIEEAMDKARRQGGVKF